MKKISGFVLALSMLANLIIILPITAVAETDGVYTYTIWNGEATITGCDNSASGEIVIPDTLDGYPVTAISDYVFSWADGITGITLADSIASIGDSAFEGCYNMKFIKLSKDLSHLGDNAFLSCGSLEEVFIPKNVVHIGDNAFSSCDSLTTINVDSNNKNFISIDGCLLTKNMTELIQYPIGKTDKTYTVLDSIISISSMAFAGSQLESIKVSANNANYTSIDGVLYSKDKTKLIAYASGKTENKYEIPSTVLYINNYAFYFSRNLTYINVPNSVLYIGEGAFCGCLINKYTNT